MIEKLKKEWIFYTCLIFLSLFYLWGMKLVPFHPDESTQIYMSQDPYDFIKDPLSLSYSPGTELTSKMTYRAIDMPLTRYLVGIARFVTHSSGLPVDWNWSLSWEQNLAAGAYPSSSLLNTARFIPTILLSATVYFFYFSIRKVLPITPALASVLFFGLNPLVLLHARRAMAESALLFGVTLFLWSITRDRSKPILIGAAIAIAFNAKQTGLFLIPVGIIAVCSLPHEEHRLKKMLGRSASLLLVFLIITLLLNPYYWKAPFPAILAGYQVRVQLLGLQIADHLQGVKPNFLQLSLSLISNTFITPPAVSEIDKYLVPLSDQIQNYWNIFPHRMGRGLIGGSLQITLFLSGFYVLITRYTGLSKTIQHRLLLILIATIVLILGLLFFLPIPWQRYVIPILPFISFWYGYGLLPLTDVLKTVISSNNTHPDRSNGL